MIGTLIADEYEVLELIGRGSFGEVYACSEKSMEGSRRVALKILNSNLDNVREIERFTAEGRILASFNHANVVSIFRFGKHEESPFIVMELIEGETLFDLTQRTTIPLPKALSIMIQVAAGLSAIHSKGIVHRDLKPNNIMVAPDGTAKVFDLGLARDISHLSTITREGKLAGTLAYMSPEQIESKPATPSSDIFSFGTILYEVVTGHHPFEAEHHMSWMYNIVNRDPKPLSNYYENPPEALVQMIDDCLTKDPLKRVSDISQVHRRLAELSRVDHTSTTVLDGTTGSAIHADTHVNPYLNRAMLRRWGDFYGRTNEVRRIYARLNATPPGSISIVGDRKIGKSSLMNYLYMRQNRESFLESPDRMIMVFLDLQEDKGMSIESFVEKLIRMVQLELRGRSDISDCALSLDGIKSLVERLHEDGFHMAILLDEFDCITTNPNFDLEFFAFLRFLANHYNVAYLTSSIRDLQTLCHTDEISDSPFFNIFSTLRLSVFREEEAQDLIGRPSERVGKPLEPYTERIVNMAGRFPFFLQIACSHAIDWMEENPEQDPDFDQIYNRFYKEAQMHYRFIWSKLDRHEQSAISRVALGKKVPDSLHHVLTELQARHLVEESGDAFRLYPPSFEEYVRSENRSGSRAPWWRRAFSKG